MAGITIRELDEMAKATGGGEYRNYVSEARREIYNLCLQERQMMALEAIALRYAGG